MKRSDTLVIVNPIAGQGRARRARASVASHFEARGRRADFVESSSTESFRQLASQAVTQGYLYVIALGGDGAFHHLVEATLCSDVILGFLPAGSGNDIAEGLGLPKDPIAAAQIYFQLEKQPRPIDVVRAHFSGAEAVFVGAGGLGLDAEAAQFANTRFHRWPGFTRYIAGALWAWRKFSAIELFAEIDGQRLQRRVLFAAVANAPCYGSGVRIAPSAEMGDGWLEITLVHEMPLLKLLRAIPIVLRSGDIRWPEVERFRCRRAAFITDRVSQVHGDGEPLGQSPVEFEILPGAIRVVAPARSENGT